MSKLLSDEEMLWHIRKTENPNYACEFKQDNTEQKTVKCGGCLHSSESARNAENALLDLINAQKRLAVESVIGEDEATTEYSYLPPTLDEMTKSAHEKAVRNQLRAEQRRRIK